MPCETFLIHLREHSSIRETSTQIALIILINPNIGHDVKLCNLFNFHIQFQ
jgi:hypothetical protein